MKAELAFVVLFSARMAAAKESFDIARYVSPPGWQRTQSPKLLKFQIAEERNGEPCSGQIHVFPSEPGRGAPAQNFEAAWSKLILAVSNEIGPPQQHETEQTPDGWTVSLGTADYSHMGVPSRAILVNATGHGRTMSMVAHVQGQGLLADVEAFFKDLDLVAGPAQPPSKSKTSAASPAEEEPTAPAKPAAGDGSSIANYVFTPPRGWGRTEHPDGVTYVSPPYPETGEKCQLTLFPMRAGSGDLLREAVGAFRGIFKVDPMSHYPNPDPKIARGTSPFGWEYLVLRKEIGGNGYVGETTTGVIVFVARLGSDVALIVGTSAPFLVSHCFGEMFPDQWPPFFHTLRFKNFREKVSDTAMAARLLGSWTSFGGHALNQYTFDKSGRYASGSAIGYTSRVSRDLVETTTYGFRGDGTWAVRGNTITITEDKDKRSPDVGLFRLEQESEDASTWKERLCILNKYGDICYRREP